MKQINFTIIKMFWRLLGLFGLVDSLVGCRSVETVIGLTNSFVGGLRASSFLAVLLCWFRYKYILLRQHCFYWILSCLLPLAHVDLRLFYLVLLLKMEERHMDSLVLNSRVDLNCNPDSTSQSGGYPKDVNFGH